MKTLGKIPTGKLERTGSILKAGAKVGANYIKYIGNKAIKNEDEAKAILHQDNAADIYDSLKNLKGSALKVAQMISMERNFVPSQYVEQFSLSQFSVPPLSYPLVQKSFRQYFGKNPEEIFDQFEQQSCNAASIGQVHRAQKDGRSLAVKIQYPGVRDSISSDLKLVKPIAMKIFNIRKEGSEEYFKEIEEKLYEETDYQQELKNSMEIGAACKHIPNLHFPQYYPQWSADRVLTMDWLDGVHFSSFVAQDNDAETRNRVGQALWDFYMFQIHRLRKVHADPHPGNFLISPSGTLQVIDFGCVKEIPEAFYHAYFEITQKEHWADDSAFIERLHLLDMLRADDTPEEREFFTKLFREMLELFTEPLHHDVFDFGDEAFFQRIMQAGQSYAQMNEVQTMNITRGSKHFIYVNRAFFGLFNMLHDLRAVVRINHWENHG